MSNYTVANQVYEKQYEFAKLAFEKKKHFTQKVRFSFDKPM